LHTPPTIQSTTIYPLRNGNDIIVPFCRLSLTRDSFIPATVREWNSLNLSVRNLDTLSKFKKAIRNSISMPIPRHYSYGPRKLNIILAQLRCNATFLNYDLCKVKILSNAFCNCGAPCENYHHFFFDCDQGRIQGGVCAPGARPPIIGNNFIFWRKIVIFHTKYPKYFRASLGPIFLSSPPLT
jgi:hypothetical protein